MKIERSDVTLNSSDSTSNVVSGEKLNLTATLNHLRLTEQADESAGTGALGSNVVWCVILVLAVLV